MSIARFNNARPDRFREQTEFVHNVYLFRYCVSLYHLGTPSTSHHPLRSSSAAINMKDPPESLDRSFSCRENALAVLRCVRAKIVYLRIHVVYITRRHSHPVKINKNANEKGLGRAVR